MNHDVLGDLAAWLRKNPGHRVVIVVADDGHAYVDLDQAQTGYLYYGIASAGGPTLESALWALLEEVAP